jgi:hypothetical protein
VLYSQFFERGDFGEIPVEASFLFLYNVAIRYPVSFPNVQRDVSKPLGSLNVQYLESVTICSENQDELFNILPKGHKTKIIFVILF